MTLEVSGEVADPSIGEVVRSDIAQALDRKMHLFAHIPLRKPLARSFVGSVLRESNTRKRKVVFLADSKDLTWIRDSLVEAAGSGPERGRITLIDSRSMSCQADTVFVEPSDVLHHCTRPGNIEGCRFQSEFDVEAYRQIKANGGGMMRDLEDRLKGKGMCPARLSLDLALESDFLVADHSLLFSEGYEKVLQYLEIEPARAVLVICDPAGLLDFLNRRFEYNLYLEDLDPARWDMKGLTDDEAAGLKAILSVLAGLALEHDPKNEIERRVLIEAYRERTKDGGLTPGMGNLMAAIKRVLDNGAFADIGSRRRMNRFYMFLKLWMGQYTAVSRARVQRSGRDAVSLSIVDISVISQPVLEPFSSVILFGDALYPQNIYGAMLGLREERSMNRSYADKKTLNGTSIISLGNVDTSYQNRTEDQYKRIVLNLRRISETTPGRCVVVFPSYFVMEQVMDEMNREVFKKSFLTEVRDMPREERKKLLMEFQNGGDILALTVQNGVIERAVEEGAVHPDSVVLVGLHLPPPSPGTSQMRLHMQRKHGTDKGHMMSVLLPATTRVMRLVNGMSAPESGKGNVVILMDRRYQDRRVLECFPRYYDVKLLSGDSEYSGEKYVGDRGGEGVARW